MLELFPSRADIAAFDDNKTITADIIIELELALKITDTPSLFKNKNGEVVEPVKAAYYVGDDPLIYKNYVEIPLNGLLPEPGEDDLLNRTSPDDTFSGFSMADIQNVKVTLRNYTNDLLTAEDLRFIVYSKDSEDRIAWISHIDLMESAEGVWSKVSLESMPFPLIPRFAVLAKKNYDPQNGVPTAARLSVNQIRPDSDFSFQISLEASVNIHQTISIKEYMPF
jgi:hypothetical protein